MKGRPPPLSLPRFRFVWTMLKALRAEWKGQFDRALQLVDKAAVIMPLGASDRVHRTNLLLKAERTREAHAGFAALRDEFKGSEDADLQYLRYYCTHQLSLLTPGSGQWSYEAKQAQLIKCRASLKRRFPMITVDDIHETIKSR